MHNFSDKHTFQSSMDTAEAVDRLRLTLEDINKTLQSIDDSISGLVPHGFNPVSSTLQAVADAIEDISYRE